MEHTDLQNLDTNDPHVHTQHLKTMLNETIRHCREDIPRISDTRLRAMFETTAEVLKGLVTAYDHYDQGREAAFH